MDNGCHFDDPKSVSRPEKQVFANWEEITGATGVFLQAAVRGYAIPRMVDVVRCCKCNSSEKAAAGDAACRRGHCC